MICNASIEDIDYILEITSACSLHMINGGIFQWNEFYPSRKAFEKDVDRDELYFTKYDN